MWALQKIHNGGLCYLFSHNIMSSVQNKIHRFGNTPINLWVRQNSNKLFITMTMTMTINVFILKNYIIENC